MKFLVFVCCVVPLVAQTPDFAGPSVLSRGTNQQRRSKADTTLQPFISVGASYDTDLTPFSVDRTGVIPRQDSYGIFAAAGVDLVHVWRRSSLSIRYMANARHYPREDVQGNDGINQSLAVTYNGEIGRSWAVGFSELASMTSRSTYAPIPTQLAPGLFTPSVGFFDNRSIITSTMGNLVYQPTRRWSFNMGGGMTTSSYQSSGLTGMLGYTATGDAIYRLTRKTSVGATYSYGGFSYTKSYGETMIQALAGEFSHQFTRHWSLQTMAGVNRAEINALTKIEVDPIIAAILGSAVYGYLVDDQIHYGFTGNVRVAGNYAKHNVSFDAMRGITPGNGLYTTSQQDLLRAGYSYNGIRTVGVSLNAAYTRIHAVQQSFAPSESYQAGFAITHPIFETLSSVLTMAYIKDKTPFSGLNRSGYTATFSLAYSPKAIPLPVW